MAELLIGKPVAENIFQQIKDHASQHPLRIATIGFVNQQWLQYVGAIRKSAEQCGVEVVNMLADGMTPQEFFDIVREVAQSDVQGVLLQQPLPKEYASAVELIPANKDVDCLNTLSVARLYKGEQPLCPATPTAVLLLLDFYGINLQGKRVVIVGRGNAVGKPLALMCLKRNATVTVCHTKTVDLPSVCRQADIIISACGAAGLITDHCVTPNSVVIDVGLSFVDGKTCGDVAESVRNVAKAVSPVPGGVGPVTRAALFSNLLAASKLQ